MEDTIELRELLDILIKRKLIVIVVTLATLILGAVYSMFMITPMYKSEATLMVNGSKGLSAGDIAASFDLGMIDANQKIVVTYGEIVKSRKVLSQVIDRLKLDMTYKELLGQISSQPVGSTEILSISVQNPSPEKAALITNTITDVFNKEVMRILKVDNVEIIDEAIAEPEPVNVNLMLNMAISLVLGLMLGVFIIFGLEYMDNTIKTAEDVEKHLGLTVLGATPDFEQFKKN